MPTARNAKLRVGIVVEGRLVAERLVGRGESLVLGGGRGDLAVPGWSGRQPVLEGHRGGWTLVVPDGATARVAVNGRAERTQGPGHVHLAGSTRGKLELEGATVLFQAVEATIAAPTTAPRLRPRVVQSDDALLVGFMPFFAALGLLVVALAPPPQEETIEEVLADDSWRVIHVPAPPLPEVVPVDVEAPPPAPAPDVTPAPEPAVESPAPRRASGRGEGHLRILEMVTRGDAEGGLLASGSTEDVEAALRNLGGPLEGATASMDGPRGRPGGTGEDAEITLGLIGDPRGSSVEDLATTVAGDVEIQEPDPNTDADLDAVRAVVTSGRGQLKWCYEQRAKSRPDLEGRVEVAWVVHGGRVTAAELVVDETGDAELGRCVVERVRRWRFPHHVEGEISWPFLFRPKE